MSASRRLRSARKEEAVHRESHSASKSPLTPQRRDIVRAKQLGAELSAKRILQARRAKVDLRSEYCESGQSASRLELQSQLSTSKLK